ncbi:MAG: 30S ribosomal protein S4 [Candidatus Shikimatogenerans sp. Ttur]|uniref:Small ribosomal subunit protein uS4 n=1 Tax=Candidatus Shikimatogenerans sp. Ttur TaxID=3158569 RepID=A0AAU7ZXX5_9FLAO
MKYLGAKNKISKKYNYPIYGKVIKKNNSLGYVRKKRYVNFSQYYFQLFEKQKLKYIYGISERQLKNNLKKKQFIFNFELRLDNLIYRLKFVNSRLHARQLINHNHVLVNKKIVNIPSYIIKINDKITFVKKILNNIYILNNINKIKKNKFIFSWLFYNKNYTSGGIKFLPKIEDIPEKINLKLVLEYYSK